MAADTQSPPKDDPKAAPKSNNDSVPKNDQASKDNMPTKEERRQEAQKAAQKALDLQKQAKELTQAAAGASDDGERQKLLHEALNKSVEAESLGKTAKYLESGAFQGFLAGGGIGTGAGAGLGALTGTLVGGVSSLVLGGLGSGIGSVVGAVHGPWLKPLNALGNLGNGITSIAGKLPGWIATDKQKEMLEKMIGQVNEQDRPSIEDLKAMTSSGGMEGKQEKKSEDKSEDSKDKPAQDGSESQNAASNGDQSTATRKKPRKLQVRSQKTTPST